MSDRCCLSRLILGWSIYIMRLLLFIIFPTAEGMQEITIQWLQLVEMPPVRAAKFSWTQGELCSHLLILRCNLNCIESKLCLSSESYQLFILICWLNFNILAHFLNCFWKGQNLNQSHLATTHNENFSNTFFKELLEGFDLQPSIMQRKRAEIRVPFC